MVVKNKQTGKWMMAGGHVDRGEPSMHAAVRELREEAGVRSPRHVSKVSGRGGVSFYTARVSMPRSRKGRMRVFSARTTPRETSDYGFVNPYARGPLVVTDYKGKHKIGGTSFRRGTVSQLRQL